MGDVRTPDGDGNAVRVGDADGLGGACVQINPLGFVIRGGFSFYLIGKAEESRGLDGITREDPLFGRVGIKEDLRIWSTVQMDSGLDADASGGSFPWIIDHRSGKRNRLFCK